MEQQIATLAGREEIAVFRYIAQHRALIATQDILPAAPDVSGALAIAALGNEGARGADILARERAVEADMHEAARPQQREQRAPALRPVAHVMEHAAHFDQIKAAPKCGELQDIGLRIVDMVEMNRARLADGVTEAGTAQIDG